MGSLGSLIKHGMQTVVPVTPFIAEGTATAPAIFVAIFVILTVRMLFLRREVEQLRAGRGAAVAEVAALRDSLTMKTREVKQLKEGSRRTMKDRDRLLLEARDLELNGRKSEDALERLEAELVAVNSRHRKALDEAQREARRKTRALERLETSSKRVHEEMCRLDLALRTALRNARLDSSLHDDDLRCLVKWLGPQDALALAATCRRLRDCLADEAHCTRRGVLQRRMANESGEARVEALAALAPLKAVELAPHAATLLVQARTILCPAPPDTAPTPRHLALYRTAPALFK